MGVKPQPKPKAKIGRPPHQPTDQTRQLVKALVVAGYNQEKIAGSIGVEDKALRRHYRSELDTSKAVVDAMVTQTIIARANGGTDKDRRWQDASDSCAIFYAKTRMGWKEPKPDPQDVNLKGAVGVYDLSKLDLDELKRIEAILARAAIAVAGGDPGGDS